ncbi:MAG TPA: thiamine pyrophosphate-binding protein [Burkholderiales bacterium]|nr:thiamine pyrophosphate-binding protein [Burkholderiales bacterium]
MKVYERMAEAFQAEGTTHVFGMMGDGNMYWMNALIKRGVSCVEVRHEGVGMGMADGWARHNQTPGVATATCGPGVTQLATACVVAARAESPVVAFVGERPAKDPDYHQRLNQSRFADGVETAFIRLDTGEFADEAVRRAFYMAKLERRPVMLSAPMDVQQEKWDDDEPYRPSAGMMPRRAGAMDEAALRKAADLIAKSKKPVIVVGRGAIWSGAGDAVLKLGERIGGLIASSLRAKTWLADRTEYHAGVSGLYAQKPAMQLFHEADLVIGVGASLNRHTTEHGYLYPNAKYIQLDPKPHVVLGNGNGADVYVQSDAKEGLEALDALLEKRGFKQPGFRTGETLERLSNLYDDPTEFDIEPGTIDPRQVVRAVDELVPGDVGLFIGNGASSSITTMNTWKTRPYVHTSGFFGCIGQMLPTAMGATIANGNKPAMLIDGDASTIMHLSDFDTVVRCKMPLLIVVLNDEALGSEYQKLRAHDMDPETSAIPSPDLGAIARAYGARGCLARTVEDVRKGVQEWVAKPGPMIIDARISKAVINLPMRRVLYGKDE